MRPVHHVEHLKIVNNRAVVNNCEQSCVVNNSGMKRASLLHCALTAELRFTILQGHISLREGRCNNRIALYMFAASVRHYAIKLGFGEP